MPFGMGRAGWCMWPYMPQWLYYQFPWYGLYSGYGQPYPYVPITKDDETKMLQEQEKILEEQLAQIKSRISELQKEK